MFFCFKNFKTLERQEKRKGRWKERKGWSALHDSTMIGPFSTQETEGREGGGGRREKVCPA